MRAADAAPGSRGCAARRTAPRCGCGSSHRDDGHVRLTPATGGSATRPGASTSPRISPPTSSPCCPRAPRSIGRDVDGADAGAEPVRPGHIAVLVAHQPPRRARARRPRRRRRPRRDQRRRQRVPRPGRPRLARPPRGARAAGVAAPGAGRRADRVPRLVGRTGRHGRRRGVGGRLRPRPPVGRPAPPARRRRAARGGDAHASDLPGRLLARADGERQLTDLRHIGQLLHLEAMSEQLGITALAGWLRRRIAEAADDNGRRGPQPPAGVRLRGRAGADDPPQQGPRVPDRLLPVPVAPGLDPRRPGPARVPRPGRRRPPDDRRRRAGQPRLRRPPRAARRRGARRGAAARLRGADAGAPPGGGVVGQLVGQPAVAARPAALRLRRHRARLDAERRATWSSG